MRAKCLLVLAGLSVVVSIDRGTPAQLLTTPGVAPRDIHGLGYVGWADAAISPDNQIAAISSARGLAIWNLGTGTLVQLREDLGAGPLSFSDDGNQLVLSNPFGSDCGAVVDTSSWSITQVFNFSISPLANPLTASSASAISSDGALVALGHQWGGVAVYDAATGAEKWIESMSGSDFKVHSLAFSGDGSRLIVGRLNQDTKVYDSATGNVICTHPADMGDQNFSMHTVDLSADGSRGLTCGGASAILFDIATGTTLREFGAYGGGVPVYLQFVDGDTKAFFSTYWETTVYDLAVDPAVVVSQLDTAALDVFRQVGRPSNDGSVIVGSFIGSSGWQAGAVSCPAGGLVSNLPGYQDAFLEGGYLPRTREYWFGTWSSITFLSADTFDVTRSYSAPSIDFQGFVDVNSSGTLTPYLDLMDIGVSELETGTMPIRIHQADLENGKLVAADFSRDDSLLLMGDTNGRAHLLDLETSSVEWSTGRIDGRGINDVALTSDKRLAIIGDGSGNIHFLNSENGETSQTLKLEVIAGRPARSIGWLAISPSGRYLFVVGDGSGGVYDLVDNVFLWKKGGIQELRGAFSPDEEWITLMSFYGQLVTRSVATGALRNDDWYSPMNTETIAYSSDGSALYGVGNYTLPCIWDAAIPTVEPSQAILAFRDGAFYHDLNGDGVVDCADEIFR